MAHDATYRRWDLWDADAAAEAVDERAAREERVAAERAQRRREAEREQRASSALAVLVEVLGARAAVASLRAAQPDRPQVCCLLRLLAKQQRGFLTRS